MSKYEIISLENSECLKDDLGFNYVNKIQFGNDSFYFVLKNGNPFLLVEVDLISLFDTAVVFYEYLCIGSKDRVYFINMNGFECRKLAVQMYFGYFYIHNDLLLVLDGEGVIAFDNKIHEVWRQPNLAADGVVVDKIENDNILVLSCEIDPPGGWTTKKINIFNGKEM